MPGYAISPDQSSIFIVEPETLDELYGKVFYGIKYDPSEGQVSVEIIREGEIIRLPETNDFKTYEYAHWFSSSKSINFVWEDTFRSTHLLMEVV